MCSPDGPWASFGRNSVGSLLVQSIDEPSNHAKNKSNRRRRWPANDANRGPRIAVAEFTVSVFRRGYQRGEPNGAAEYRANRSVSCARKDSPSTTYRCRRRGIARGMKSRSFDMRAAGSRRMFFKSASRFRLRCRTREQCGRKIIFLRP